VRIDQVILNLAPGDAMSEACLAFQAIFRRAGFHSDLYAVAIAPVWRDRARPFRGRLHPPPDLLIYHYGIGSPLTEAVLALPHRLVLYYHNVTPAWYFIGVNDILAGQALRGRAELALLARRAVLGLAPSEYSARELRTWGLPTAVVPLPLALRRLGPPGRTGLGETGPTVWLFVGRLVPNKCQHDVLAAFAEFQRRVDPAARLVLVGTPAVAPAYADWLQELVARWGVRAVEFPGHVPAERLAAYYRTSTVFVCLSEHEGVGLPLIEAMYCDLPVVAYAAGAVPETLGGAGILLRRKEPALVATVVAALLDDRDLRQAVVARQRARWQALAAQPVDQLLLQAVARILGAPGPVSEPGGEER